VEIVETQIFTKRIVNFLSDNEYKDLQWTLMANPVAGRVIPGGNGLRKIRWHITGSGKSGGLRIIYYYFTQREKIYMFFCL